jgi:hypothetical protein
MRPVPALAVVAAAVLAICPALPAHAAGVTDDDSVISVSSDTLTIVKGNGNRLELLQLMKVVNSSDRTYTGRGLRFPLPGGAFDVTPIQGLDLSKLTDDAEGFVSSDPVAPGTTEVGYLYRIRAGRSGWPMQRAVVYPTDHVDVLVGPGLALSAGNLRFAEAVTLKGVAYKRWRGGPFRSGSVVEAGIGFSDGGPSSGLWWGTAAGLLVAILVAGFASLRMKKRKRAPAPAARQDRPRIVEEIARLDEDFASGAVVEGDYRERRQILKSQLEEMAEPARVDS